jgi:hypothetical protein
MKFTKPIYDAKQRIYSCDISDGFRFSVRRENGVFVKPLDSCIDSDESIAHLIKSTQGWFSKPLTQDFLKEKIRYDIPTDVPETFEGSVEWQIQKLVISKEQFLFIYGIIHVIEDDKVCIEFPEESGLEEEVIPLDSTSNEVIGIGPTRRTLEKAKIMATRAKAARALFNAERLTQEFYAEFGETDWEDGSDED